MQPCPELLFSAFSRISAPLLCLTPAAICSGEPNLAELVDMYNDDLSSPELIEPELRRWKLMCVLVRTCTCSKHDACVIISYISGSTQLLRSLLRSKLRSRCVTETFFRTYTLCYALPARFPCLRTRAREVTAL